jgi:YegS/Rv2252/BmrU family lipid kinase
MPPYLLINPLSGSYSPALRDQLLAQLETAGISPKVLTVTGPDDARRVCALLEAEDQNPVVIVAGGDGTINAVINALTPGRATLGVLPVGTANVLAHELGINSVAAGIECIANGKSRPLAVGLIERSNSSSQRFLLMAGIGLDGSIVQGVRLREKRLLKKGAYLLSALRCLLRWPQGRFPVIVDGKTHKCHSVIICNGARYGGKLKLVPHADISEPSLELFCITSESRLSYLRIITSVLSGRPCSYGDVTLMRAVQVEICGDRPIQVDGDSCGSAPVKIETIADFAKIYTP